MKNGQKKFVKLLRKCLQDFLTQFNLLPELFKVFNSRRIYIIFFLTKDLSISLIKYHKALTSQSINIYKIIVTCYEVT
jgi:hypothetical protein